jgi:hypothetical protein
MGYSLRPGRLVGGDPLWRDLRTAGIGPAFKARLSDVLPVDLAGVLHTELDNERRPPDGLLHASTHLEGSLRHAQLDVAGAPKIRETFVRGMPLWMGSLIHEDIHRILRKVGLPYMAEVDVSPWLPEGWGGRPDAVIWSPDLAACVLADFKTIKGEGVKYLDGAKPEHVSQTSIYWHALRKMGLPMAEKIAVLYLPKNEAKGVEGPVTVDFEPLEFRELAERMAERKRGVDEYLLSLDESEVFFDSPLEHWLTDALADVQPMVQKVFFDKASGDHVVKQGPHWSAVYCAFAPPLCTCSEQTWVTIGRYDIELDRYVPRKGYEEIEPTVAPD